MMDLREIIRQKMRVKRLRVSSLARQAGVRPTTLYDYLRRDCPTETNTQVLLRVLDALGLVVTDDPDSSDAIRQLRIDLDDARRLNESQSKRIQEYRRLIDAEH